jgi:hypothetical protein
MNPTKKAFLDVMLALVGVTISTSFVALDGNGRNPLPVFAGMCFVALFTGLVSVALAWMIRSVPFSALASILITNLAFVLYFVSRVAYAKRTPEHASEEAFLLPIVFVVVAAPTVVLASIGFGRLANRVFRKLSPTAG